jgi:hypothetical protein
VQSPSIKKEKIEEKREGGREKEKERNRDHMYIFRSKLKYS